MTIEKSIQKKYNTKIYLESDNNIKIYRNKKKYKPPWTPPPNKDSDMSKLGGQVVVPKWINADLCMYMQKYE